MLDIKSNRVGRKYGVKEQMLRCLWGIVKVGFRLVPRPFFGIRRWILQCFGAKIGRETNIYPSAVIYFPWNFEIGEYSAIGEDCLIYNLGPVVIGSRTTISHKAHLCAGTHDHTFPSLPLIRSSIIVGDDVWICADSFIGPDVQVMNGAIVGARASVFRDVLAFQIVGGNPAKVIGIRKLNSLDPPSP